MLRQFTTTDYTPEQVHALGLGEGELEDQVAVVLERPAFRRYPRLLDQLARSSEGPPVHISEGFSRFYPSENAPFVRIARARPWAKM